MAKVIDLFRHINQTNGLVGIEIEVEGRRLPEAIGSYWKREHDGSLRGESAEYVLKKPVALDKVEKALGVLTAAYKKNNTEVNNESPRTGVHVHVNVQDLDMVKVFNMITLYHALEELMVRFCGKGREGNLFCLRMKDAEFLAEFYLQALQNREWGILATDEIRYASLNVTALHKFGSLEFRSMRGTDDFGLIQTWVDMLVKLKEAAELYQDPVAIVESLSRDGEMHFLETVLGAELAQQVIAPDAEESIREGIRSIQNICYDVDWALVANNERQAHKLNGLTLEELGIERENKEGARFQPRREGADPELAAYWRNLPQAARMEIRELAERGFNGDVVAALINFRENNEQQPEGVDNDF